MIKKVLISLFVIYLSIIFFMPKQEILYTVLNLAQKQKIQFLAKEQGDMGFYQSLQDIDISYDGSKYAFVSNAKILPLLFYNHISLSSIHPSASFRALLPFAADDIKLIYHIFNPFKVSITGSGDFGEIDGNFSLETNKLKIILTPSNEFKKSNLIKEFKKTKEGYIYESTIR